MISLVDQAAAAASIHQSPSHSAVQGGATGRPLPEAFGHAAITKSQLERHRPSVIKEEDEHENEAEEEEASAMVDRFA